MTKQRVCCGWECSVPIGETYLMCSKHWRMVPQVLKKLITDLWARDKKQGKPSETYCEAIRLAQLLVRRQIQGQEKILPE